MTGGGISYRRCRPGDLTGTVRLFVRSFNDLRLKCGMKPLPFRVDRVPGLVRHLFDTNRETFYIAWRGKRLVGMGCAVVRGGQWYLAWLFVDPRYQDRGIGRGLLEKVWRDRPGMSHALATMTYNQQAVGLYSRFGMDPREFLMMMEGKREKIVTPPPTGLDTVRRLSRADFAWIHEVEKEIRGYPHREEWRFWNESDETEIFLYRRGGRRVGYSVLNVRGGVMPIGAERTRDFPAVLTETVRTALGSDRPVVSFICPNSNTASYRFLHESGFRNSEMLLFMSDRDYGDFRRYFPASLAVF